MKKFLFLGVVTFFSTLLFAQSTNQNLLSPVGNVGIGTTSPSKKLEVRGETMLEGHVLLKDELVLDKFKLIPPTALERILTIDRDGKVIPIDVMEVIRLHGDPIGGLAQNFWSLSGNNGVTTSNFLGSTNEAPLIFKTKGIERMRIVGNDTKVGIGTNDPKKALHIKTIHQGAVSGGGGQHHSHYGIRLEDFTSYSGGAPNVSTIWDIEPFEKNLVIGKPLQPLLTLTDDNKVVINGNLESRGIIKVGTSSLYIKGFSDAGGGQVSSDNSIYCDGGPLFINKSEGQGTLQNTIINLDGGRVGIGNSSPESKLHVSGSGNQWIAVSTTDALASFTRLMAVTSNGRTESQIQYKGRLTFVEPLSGDGKMTIFENGNVSIGTSSNSYKLDVGGTIRACKIEVIASDWCDYVFEENYKLMPLEELSYYLKQNKHLPEIPTEKEVINNGIDLGEMVLLQQKKIEELTLYIIELNERLNSIDSNSIEK